MTLWLLASLAIAGPLLGEADDTTDAADVRADAVAGDSGVSVDASGGALGQRLRERRRSRMGEEVASEATPTVDPWVGVTRPGVFAPRKPWGAFALGGLIGFGAGYYYAGDSTLGLTFTCIDALVIGTFIVSTVALNQLVVEHDFRSGKSLARDERSFGKLEARWYAASVVLALSAVGSRLFQAVGSMRTARDTNETLTSFAFVPLGAGGALQLTW